MNGGSVNTKWRSLFWVPHCSKLGECFSSFGIALTLEVLKKGPGLPGGSDMTDSNTHDSEQATETLIEVTGLVKWFDPRKGFGFIVGPDEQDIFVHFTVIEGDGFRVLKDGSSVCYDAEHNDKGWRATKVHRVESDTEVDDETPEVVVPRRTYSRTPRR